MTVPPLVLVDGMRVYEDALAIQKELDSTSKVYKTAILVCPDTVRAQRILRDSDRQYRDTARLTTQQEILADEQADLNGSYNFAGVLNMHDLTAEPINTACYTIDEVAAQITLAMRPYIRI